ncbi:MAG TPA: pyridoxal-phosphate dependent enzyme [Myxococcota bacterium]|nr:pyridoxal-phosphate dependent enzyme [Myxococcota bacterium]
MNRYAVDLDAIRDAACRIRPHAHRTPILRCAALDALAGRRLHFKCENFQKVGAFKFRGACNAVMSLPADQASRGVATHSSGNHAQALALAARIRGIPAHVVMPLGSPAVKRRAVVGYGARVIDCAPNLAARETTAAEVVAQTGAVLIPPYDHPWIIAGQGTVALEAFDEVPRAGAIVAPIGGGGLLSGIALATRELAPGARIVAAEPAGADDAFRSKAAGRLILQEAPDTVADGLRTSLGTLTWPVVRDVVHAIDTVSDAAIVAAMRLLWERMKIVVEPSAATALAVVLSDAFRARETAEDVIVVLSGGNVDLDALPFGKIG